MATFRVAFAHFPLGKDGETAPFTIRGFDKVSFPIPPIQRLALVFNQYTMGYECAAGDAVTTRTGFCKKT